ncbi:MAG TPA: aldo/keto reductase, partial [Reyranella sp.]|nr:aldo/keto reductase [Reyranella sp.]
VYPLGGSLEHVGRTEEILGRWLEGRRHRFIVATKCVGRMGRSKWDQGASRKHILDAVDASLRRLGTDYIDLYQLHNARLDPIHDDALWEELDRFRVEGKVRELGVALGPAIGWVEEGLDSVRERPIVSLQTVFNVLAPPSFMVFFDWDRSNLSQQALTTIQQAANAFKTKGNARITATGHTDTSGPESYNMALSLRRANAVKDALVRNGVPAQAITVVGMGEKGLLVQTGDNVREPQNRRVEIVIQ